MKPEFSRQVFQKILKYQISWKSVQSEPSCSMRTDGQTDMTKLTVAFRNFANWPKKCPLSKFMLWHRGSQNTGCDVGKVPHEHIILFPLTVAVGGLWTCDIQNADPIRIVVILFMKTPSWSPYTSPRRRGQIQICTRVVYVYAQGTRSKTWFHNFHDLNLQQ